MNRRNMAIAGAVVVASGAALVAVTIAQAPPDPPPPPVVVGRDIRETGQVIGKEFALRVRLLDVAGPGVQQIKVIRVAPDGTLTLPRIAPLKAEGVAIATLEAQASAAYKAVSPTAAAFISIADRTPPAPPPPPPATPPPPPPAPAPATSPVPPATTRAASTTKPAAVAVVTAASQPTTGPVK